MRQILIFRKNSHFNYYLLTGHWFSIVIGTGEETYLDDSAERQLVQSALFYNHLR